MSMKDCINAKAKAGLIDGELAKDAADEWEQTFNSAREGMPEADAQAFAARKTLESQTDKIKKNAANRARTVAESKVISARMDAYRDGAGKKNVARGAFAVLNRDIFDQSHQTNVWVRIEKRKGDIHAKAESSITAYYNRIGGFKRDSAGQDNLIREAFGVETGDATAKNAFSAWNDASGYAVKLFNRAGGDITLRKRWGLPQIYDSSKVVKIGRRKGKDAIEAERVRFKEFIGRHVDRDFVGFDLYGRRLSDNELDKLLSESFDSIRSNGLIGQEPSFISRTGSLANTRMQHRHLIYKNADSWLAVQREYGKGSIYEVMTGHMDNMARDIGMMEVLGPNPPAMVNFMKDKIILDAARGTKAQRDAASTAVWALQADFDEIRGINHIPKNVHIGTTLSGAKNILSSAQLGSAAIAATTDLATIHLAARYNGLSTTKTIIRMAKLMKPGAMETKQLAIRAGLVADNYSSMSIAQQRYVGDVMGPRWTQAFSDIVLTASGLNGWTQNGRWAFGLEFMGALGDNVGKTFDQMPEKFAQALQRYGVSESDWARLSSSNVPDVFIEKDGARFLSTQKISEFIDEELSTKIHEMVLTETEFAIPTVTPRVVRQLRLGSQAGTPSSIFAGSLAMYKSFPVSIIHLHIMRGLNQAGVDKISAFGNRTKYLASYVIGSTLMGAFAWQMKGYITRGKKFQDMFNPDGTPSAEFWTAAMIQGGGLSLAGDFIFSDVNRYGQSLTDYLAGPVLGLAKDFTTLTLGNAHNLAQGEDTNAGRETVRFINRYAPGNSLWYTRLAFERMLWDTLDKMADPRASRTANRRAITRLKNDTGQEYWWQPGDFFPD